MSGCQSCMLEGNKVSGCNNNGGCLTGGCNKMNVIDWLSNMDFPKDDFFDVVEVRFKGGKKSFYRNTNRLELITGDMVVVDVPNGHHMGYVSLQGELVRLQMLKKEVQNDEDIRKIYRVATEKDLKKYQEVRDKEEPALYKTRKIIDDLKLNMKLSDVEFQADDTKAVFYYSADERVDFRELIKILAREFKVRVEMCQISLRHEAARLGGIGSCGRELCCSTWLSDFKNVSTTSARYQNLSLNPSKLSGQCGRLKCCLNYELDTYLEALKHIPELEGGALLTEKGEALLQKTDIFRKMMWFSYKEESTWHPLSTARVLEIQSLNKKGEKPVTLHEDAANDEESFGTLNSDLEKMDRKFRKRATQRKKKRKPQKQHYRKKESK